MVGAVAASGQVEVESRDQAVDQVDSDSMIGTLMHAAASAPSPGQRRKGPDRRRGSTGSGVRGAGHGRRAGPRVREAQRHQGRCRLVRVLVAGPQLLNDGGAELVQSANGRIYKDIDDDDRPFVIVWDGNVFDLDVWSVVRGAPNRERAFEFVAFATRTKPLSGIQDVAYGPTSAKALKRSSTGGC